MHPRIFADHPKPNYWLFFVPFSTCAMLGIAGIITSEMLMPQNAAGLEGRLTIYRYLGTMTLIWASIAIWSWCQIRIVRATNLRSDHSSPPRSMRF